MILYLKNLIGFSRVNLGLFLTQALAKPIYDHVPCVIDIGTKIPKSQVFRFENYWLHHPDFKQIVQNAWNIPVGKIDCAKKINAKLKIPEEP